MRAARDADVSAIVAIFRAARATAMPWLPVLHSAEGVGKFFARRVLPQATVMLYERGGVPVGFVAQADTWIDHLYVAPAAWRTGVGGALLKDALGRMEMAQLWVFAQNTPAQAFYRQHGFVEIERTDGAGNEERCPDVRMVRGMPSA